MRVNVSFGSLTAPRNLAKVLQEHEVSTLYGTLLAKIMYWTSVSTSRVWLESLGSSSSSGSSMSSNLQLVGRVRVPTFNSNSNINFLNRLALLIQEQPSLLGYVIYGFELKIWTHGSSSSSRSGLELDSLTRYIGQCLTIAKFIERWILFIYTDSSVHLLLSIHLCLYYLKHLSFYKAHK